jgi:cytochrome P450
VRTDRDAGESSHHRTTTGLPSGPSLPVWLQTLLFVGAPLRLFASCERRYGPAYTLRLFYWGPIVFVSDLAAIRRLLAAGADVRHANEPLEPLFGDRSPMVLDGEPHARLRRALLPQMRGARLERHARLVAELVATDMECWPIGRPFALLPRMRRITADVVMSLVFGDARSGRRARLRELVVTFTRLGGHRAMLFPVMRRDLGRFSPWGYFLRLRGELDGIVYEEIRSRRERVAAPDDLDLLTALVSVTDEPLTDQEIRDVVVSLLFAGYETSAVTLSWCFDLLLHHADVLARTRVAIESDDDAYLTAVVREVLRVRTVIVAIGRRLAAPMTLAGHELPAGTHVAASIAGLHHDARIFPDPDRFRPERFLEAAPVPRRGAGASAGEGIASAWMAFGGGAHRCPGLSPAILGTTVVLRTVLSRARLRAAGRSPEGVSLGGVTAAPRRGARVVLEARR